MAPLGRGRMEEPVQKFPFITRVSANLDRLRQETTAIQAGIISRTAPGHGGRHASVYDSAEALSRRAWGTVADVGDVESAGLAEQPSRPSLLRAPKTYNTNHPDYDPTIVRNFPGCLFNADKPSANPALRAMRDVIQGKAFNDRAWDTALEAMFAELKGVAGTSELLEHRDRGERYFDEINKQYGTLYEPGWVNLDDALFLYWLIRELRPRTVVETGVCNGFSAGLIALALAENANDGQLHSIGRAETFDPNDSRWTEKGKSHGEVLIGGQTLGWMIPDGFSHFVNLYPGDAEVLLPKIVDELDSIDLFFHDSDHSYDHMMFEFCEVHRKLSSNSIVIADNIAWNSSLWDFADKYGVPAYNFRGSVGVAFFG